MVAKGDDVRYKSFAGFVYDATVVGERPGGFFDIEVKLPGVGEPVPVKAVRAERLEERFPAPKDGG